MIYNSTVCVSLFMHGNEFPKKGAVCYLFVVQFMSHPLKRENNYCEEWPSDVFLVSM